MATTLTRETLLAKAKLKYEEVDVPGFGRIGIRQRPELLRIKRNNQMFDESGSRVEFHCDRRRVYTIVDQVMIDENTPMFSAGDVEELVNCGSEYLDPLFVAVNQFNERIEPEKNEEGGSDDTSEK